MSLEARHQRKVKCPSKLTVTFLKVPYMIAGDIIACVGAGLLTTIGASTPTAQWAAYLVITGLGVGMAYQLPYTAVQAVLA